MDGLRNDSDWDEFVHGPVMAEALDYMEQFRCADCGYLTDTPNHELGCRSGRAEREGVNHGNKDDY